MNTTMPTGLTSLGNRFFRTEETLESILLDLSNYGKPQLIKLEGWHCNLDMNSTAIGTTFTVRSARHGTPIEAVIECRERMHAALKVMAGKTLT